MGYEIYTTDTAATLSGGDIEQGQWSAYVDASSYDDRKPASYAVAMALDAAVRVARTLAAEQGIQIVPYRGTLRDGQPATIEDDGRIATAVEDVRAAVAARAAKLAGQAPTPRYSCKGAKDGCRSRVASPNTYCASCAHDEE